MLESAIRGPQSPFGAQESRRARTLMVKRSPVPSVVVEPTTKTDGLFPEALGVSPIEVLDATDVVLAKDRSGQEISIPIGKIREKVALHKQWQIDNPLLLQSKKERIIQLKQQIKDNPSGEDTPYRKKQLIKLGLETLTPSEYLNMYVGAFNLTSRNAARAIGVSNHTHKHHNTAVNAKLGVSNSRGAWMNAVKHGLIDQELLPKWSDYSRISDLSQRKQEIIEAFIANPEMTHEQLAHDVLFIDDDTLRNHISSIIKTLGVGRSVDSALHFYLGWKTQDGIRTIEDLREKLPEQADTSAQRLHVVSSELEALAAD